MLAILTCRRCQKTERHEYQSNAARILSDGTLRTLSEDEPCPACRWPRRINTVRARVTRHECDDRCMSATGGVCNCSCGGKNHGMAYAAA